MLHLQEALRVERPERGQDIRSHGLPPGQHDGPDSKVTVFVKTALGKRWHLASNDDARRTYCGREFSPGYDTVSENRESLDSEICQSCGKVRARRRRRGMN